MTTHEKSTGCDHGRDQLPAFLTPAQVAEHLACGRMTVHRAIERGDLKAFRDGRLVRISRDALDAYVAAKTGQPAVRRGRRRS